MQGASAQNKSEKVDENRRRESAVGDVSSQAAASSTQPLGRSVRSAWRLHDVQRSLSCSRSSSSSDTRPEVFLCSVSQMSEKLVLVQKWQDVESAGGLNIFVMNAHLALFQSLAKALRQCDGNRP